MSKSDPASAKKERNKNIRWVITVFFTTMFISGGISVASDALMSSSGIFVAFLILLAIILVGIIFDVIGVAATSADEKPFHSMAARKVAGAQEAIKLLRNAERVSSICNDVIGDICGVVSGTASATISAQLVAMKGFSAPHTVISLVMSALVAGFTVGGKAIGKAFAVNSCTGIVYFVGNLIARIKNPFGKKKK